MTAKELIKYQMDDAAFQLSKVMEGLTEEQADDRLCETGMSPRESIAHVCDAYQAVITEIGGGKHEWGQIKFPDPSIKGIMAFTSEVRSKAVEALLASDDPKWLKEAHAYIVAHDYYHVGQLAQFRLTKTPDWDAYSIYRM